MAATLGAAALALAPAAAASAHDDLVSSTPAANATVSSALPSVTLTFDDVVSDEGGHGALVQVTDASGRNFETDCPSVSGRSVTTPVALGAPGAYRVTWQVVSADGHPVSDSIQFTYRGPRAGGGQDGPLAKCGTTLRAPAATPPTLGGANQQPGADTAATIIVIAVGIALLALIAVILVILLGRRRAG